MAVLEVRRHSWRKVGGGSQLSQRGVDLARVVGAEMGPFDRVVATVVPRARETAVAMGFAVDEELVTLSADPDLYREHQQSQWWTHDQPFAALAALIATGGAASRYANSIAAIWRDYLTPLDEGVVLVIGHSGELEQGLVAALPFADHSSWGAGFGPCEGARLTFKGDPPMFSEIEFLRVVEPDESDATHNLSVAMSPAGST